MIDKLKVINFIQDFGCAKLKHLQILFDANNDNFKSILNTNVISKKGDIFVYNNRKINYKTLVALDILCNYKGRYTKFLPNFNPIFVSFFTKDNKLYHILVSDEQNEDSVVKQINNPNCLPDGHKYILAFRDDSMFKNIKTTIPFLYCIYPSLEIIEQVP